MANNGLLKQPARFLLVIIILAITFSGCSFKEKKAETTEPSITYITGTLTLRLINRDGQPIEGKSMLASTLPEESIEKLKRTDSEGKTQWDGVKTGKQYVMVTVDDKIYNFQGEIRESDFNTTITLQIAEENKIKNGNYKFIRE